MHNRFHSEIHTFCEAATAAQNEFEFCHKLLRPEHRGLLSADSVHAVEACNEARQLKCAYGLQPDDTFIVVVDGNLYDDEDDEYLLIRNLNYPSTAETCRGVGIVSLYFLRPDSTFTQEVAETWKDATSAEIKRISSNAVLLLLLGVVTGLETDLVEHDDTRGCVFDYCQKPSDMLKAIQIGFQFCNDCCKKLHCSPEGAAILAIANVLTQNFRVVLPAASLAPASNSYKHGKTLRVVVVSPGDVNTERGIVPRVIDELNQGIAADRRLRLEVFRWETDTYPGFHADGPQGLIDTIMHIEDCDIVVGIFWKRFGTPTSDGSTGTEHEIRCAYEAWMKKKCPQVMVYFNQKASAPKTVEETDQWGKVLKFLKEFPKEGLWWPYKGTAQFEQLLRTHLTKFIRDKYPLESPPASE
jgi:hypothetical protein